MRIGADCWRRILLLVSLDWRCIILEVHFLNFPERIR